MSGMTPRVLPVSGDVDDANAGVYNGGRGNLEGDSGGSGNARFYACGNAVVGVTAGAMQ